MRAYLTQLDYTNGIYIIKLYIAKRPNAHETYFLTIAGLDALNTLIEHEEIILRNCPDAPIDSHIRLTEIKQLLKNNSKFVKLNSNQYEIFLNKSDVSRHDIERIVKECLKINSVKWNR